MIAGQPVPVVFPRQLGLLGSERLRALPRAGDDRGNRVHALEQAGRAWPWRGSRARRVVGRSGVDVLAVELRGSARGAGGARGAALGLAPHSSPAPRSSSRRGRVRVAFQGTLKIDLGTSAGLNKVSSGRADLIRGGVELFVNRPLQGYGAGAFARAYRLERKGNQQQAVSASHTMPVTVAAEQGIIGLAAYLAVLVAAFAMLFGDGALPVARRRHGRRGLTGGAADRARGAGRDVRRAGRAHDGLRRVPRGPVHLGDPGGRSIARAARAVARGACPACPQRTPEASRPRRSRSCRITSGVLSPPARPTRPRASSRSCSPSRCSPSTPLPDARRLRRGRGAARRRSSRSASSSAWGSIEAFLRFYYLRRTGRPRPRPRRVVRSSVAS